LEKIVINDYYGKSVALKANYNSADPFPASTLIDTLSTMVSELKTVKVARVTLGERNCMGNTRIVFDRIGVLKLADGLGFGLFFTSLVRTVGLRFLAPTLTS
jgi:uncharacterized protein (DUF362 family)